jgi:uncharacterized protein YkwD
MKKKFIIFVSIMCCLSFSICQSSRQEYAKKTFDYTNAFRIKRGLSKLTWNNGLATRAEEHSKNMALGKVKCGHAGFKKRIAHVPNIALTAAENVFMCNMQGDIAKICVDSWIESPGHLKNVLGNFNNCGIGVYKNAKGFWYFTQIFALFDWAFY